MDFYPQKKVLNHRKRVRGLSQSLYFTFPLVLPDTRSNPRAGNPGWRIFFPRCPLLQAGRDGCAAVFGR